MAPKSLEEFYEAVRHFCALTHAREYRILARVRYTPGELPSKQAARAHADNLGLSHRRSAQYDILYRSRAQGMTEPEEEAT